MFGRDRKKDRDRKPLPPDTRLQGVCLSCGTCVGCVAVEAEQVRDGWGDLVPALRCPNPRCKTVVFLHREK